MKKVVCPACGAEVTLKSTALIYTVCEYCRSMIVRHDKGIESIGKIADLLQDSSPLQLTASGTLEARPFTLVGRVQVGWSGGYWSEWFAAFDDGTQGWLAEAQGHFAMFFAAESAVLPRTGLLLGHSYEHEGITYDVEDVKTFRYVSCEGELPFFPEPGVSGTSLDLGGPNGACASIQFFGDHARVYVGKYIEWNELKIRGGRELHGW